MSVMARSVDLVIAFTATKKTTMSSTQIRKEALRAQQQYARLLETLTYSGLHAVGRRGESLGHLLIFISCPQELLDTLVRRERHSDFLSGLPVTPAPENAAIGPLSSADRIRLVYSYITSTPIGGGLGITPDSPDWDCVESIFPLHDKEFNESWIRSWKLEHLASVSVGKIRDEFGDSVAYYYTFLSGYTYFLIFPAALGLIAYFFFEPYSPIYSILICIWSIVFVEWWRVNERIISLRFGTRGSARVEKRRVQYKPGLKWWNKDLRVLASVPLIMLFATILAVILTGIFVLEAFVTHLYTGPGKQIISFAPTILFAALVPRVLAIYHAIAKQFTEWENHAHKSSHSASLTIKTFALSAIVAYLGLGLSAFIYVPFGEGLMLRVQLWLSNESKNGRWQLGEWLWTRMSWNATAVVGDVISKPLASAAAGGVPGRSSGGVWDVDVQHARQKLDPSRLKDQMFAYTVTNQVVDTFMEVGMPYVLRAFNNFRKKGGKGKKATPSPPSGHGSQPKSAAGVPPTPFSPSGGSVVSVSGISSSLSGGQSTSGSVSGSPSVRKRVVFEDEQERGGMEEREFLDRVRAEAALPGYDLFEDYSEMATQFGYVAVWSTIWPLASVMALVNNFFEIRSDAFKMTVHYRRPIPIRTDTIGPWLDTLTFLTWLAALTNAALVYLFSPASQRLFESASASVLGKARERLFAAAAATDFGSSSQGGEGAAGLAAGDGSTTAMERLLMRSLLIALIASHGYFLVRVLVRRVVEQVWWKERSEVKHREREVKSVREKFLKGLDVQTGEIERWRERRDSLSFSQSQMSRSENGEYEGEGERGEVWRGDAAGHGVVGTLAVASVTRDAVGGPGLELGVVLDGFWDHDEGVEEIERISKDS